MTNTLTSRVTDSQLFLSDKHKNYYDFVDKLKSAIVSNDHLFLITIVAVIVICENQEVTRGQICFMNYMEWGNKNISSNKLLILISLFKQGIKKLRKKKKKKKD